jgi:glycosyltransferase involved in cell wall biosynthesis
MVRHGETHDFFIVLNGAFPETVGGVVDEFKDLLPRDNIRTYSVPKPTSFVGDPSRWRIDAAELIREYYLKQLEPQWVHVSSVFEGLVDNAVTSVGRLAGIRAAVTQYDLIPYVFSERYLVNPTVKAWYSRKLDELRRADLVFAISSYTKAELVETLEFPSDRVVVVPAAADPSFRPVHIDTDMAKALRERYGLEREFVLYTGGIDFRKNIERLLRAYSTLPQDIRRSHQLAIVCEVDESARTHLNDLRTRAGLDPGEVKFTGYVTDEDLIRLLNLCKLFVFPSVHEGFGLPILEAMRCGAPVIGSRGTSIGEVIELEAAQFDPYSVLSIRDKIEEALGNSEFLETLRENSRRQRERYSWDASAASALNSMEGESIKPDKANLTTASIHANHPSLAYVSPLPPEQSGIADYSSHLLPELARYYKIDLVTDLELIDDEWLAKNFTKTSVAEFLEHGDKYDRILYHFGNSAFHSHMFDLLRRHPGTVVLHDFFLSGVLRFQEETSSGLDVFKQALFRSHGFQGLSKLTHRSTDELMWDYPCCLEVIQGAAGVIVNSQHSIGLANDHFGPVVSEGLVYVPQPRRGPLAVEKGEARRILDLPSDAFIVASFGFLGPTKLNHRLLESWLGSMLAKDERCLLIFVGESHGSSYEQSLRRSISNARLENQIQITGFVGGRNEYELYLDAADVAVQLRGRTRGEGGRTPLDCLAHGLPTIVNAHGTLAELPERTVLRLPGDFSNRKLALALDELSANPNRREELAREGQRYIMERSNPEQIASTYAQALEEFAASNAVASRQNLVSKIMGLDSEKHPSHQELVQIAECISENTERLTPRQLLIDVTGLIREAAGSRSKAKLESLLLTLLEELPPECRLEAVHFSDGTFRYAREFMADVLSLDFKWLKDTPVEVRPGDRLFVLELAANVQAQWDWLRHHSNRGLKLFLVEFETEGTGDGSQSIDLDALTASGLDGSTQKLADGFIFASQRRALRFSALLEKSPTGEGDRLQIGYYGNRDIEGDSDQDMAHLAEVISRETWVQPSLERPARRDYIQLDENRTSHLGIGSPSKQLALDQLRYLEAAIDNEHGKDRGPLAGKEILVYAPEKTGTSSLYWSIYEYLGNELQIRNPEYRILHNHNNRLLINNLKLPSNTPPHDLERRALVRDLMMYKQLTKGHLQVVTSMRDPLARAISHTFEVLEGFVVHKRTMARADLTPEVCHEWLHRILASFLNQPHPLQEIDTDFLHEMSFDRSTKWSHYELPNCGILALTLEASSVWKDALASSFGYQKLEVITRNIGAEKEFADIRKAFESDLKLSEDYIGNIYFGDHILRKALNWFYTKEEVNAFYQRALARYAE